MRLQIRVVMMQDGPIGKEVYLAIRRRHQIVLVLKASSSQTYQPSHLLVSLRCVSDGIQRRISS